MTPNPGEVFLECLETLRKGIPTFTSGIRKHQITPEHIRGVIWMIEAKILDDIGTNKIFSALLKCPGMSLQEAVEFVEMKDISLPADCYSFDANIIGNFTTSFPIKLFNVKHVSDIQMQRFCMEMCMEIESSEKRKSYSSYRTPCFYMECIANHLIRENAIQNPEDDAIATLNRMGELAAKSKNHDGFLVHPSGSSIDQFCGTDQDLITGYHCNDCYDDDEMTMRREELMDYNESVERSSDEGWFYDEYQ